MLIHDPRLNSGNVNPSKANSAPRNTSNEKTSVKDKTKDAPKQEKDTVWIIGDSILKHLKGHKMSSNMLSIKVSTHPGCTTRDMMDDVKPVLKSNPKKVAMDVGTNNLRAAESPKSCAEEILKLAAMVNSKETKVAISSITTRTDDTSLGKKASDVKTVVQDLCSKTIGISLTTPILNLSILMQAIYI